MRIAIPIHSFEPGGVERVALRLAEQWQTRGEDVTIVLGRDAGRCKIGAPSLNYRTLREPVTTARWETIWMIWSLFRFLLKEKVDVLFCPGNTYTVVCLAMRVLLGERCPPVLVKISNDLRRDDLPGFQRPFYRRWLRIQGGWLDHFVALADPMASEVFRELGITESRVTVIADPALDDADLGCSGNRSVAEGRAGCEFLSIGRLVPQKNQILLIDAFALHSWPDDRLTIVGEGPDRKALERHIARLGLAERVELAGHREDVGAFLERADVFVLSSNYEGVPAVIIEALAAGIPIAATNCCASMDWLLQNGRFGITARPGDPEALGLAMNLARHLEPPQDQMVKFASQFTIQRASRAYLSIMSDMHKAWSSQRFSKARERVRDWREHGV